MNNRIKKWIERNSGSWNSKTDAWDFPGDIEILDYLVENGKLLIRFGTVNEDFYCSYNKLTSLEGCPKEVNGSFDCSGNQLTSLNGCPKEVGGNFDCYSNKLTSFEGCSEKVGGYFDCSYNQLASLEGALKEVGEDFTCAHNPLESISGIFDSKISGGFYIDNMFSNKQSDEPNQFLIETMNILKNRFKSVQDKLALKVSRKSLEELEDILNTAAKLKFNI